MAAPALDVSIETHVTLYKIIIAHTISSKTGMGVQILVLNLIYNRSDLLSSYTFTDRRTYTASLSRSCKFSLRIYCMYEGTQPVLMTVHTHVLCTRVYCTCMSVFT